MKWVTWKNIGIDRMACAWLILKRIDPTAEFAFVVQGYPTPEDYEPFDIPGVHLSHRLGHCTFHTMLQEYQLDDPVLERIASIIDDADLVQDITLEPIAYGLDAICEGLRLISDDDHAAVVHGCTIYDALYARLALEWKGKS